MKAISLITERKEMIATLNNYVNEILPEMARKQKGRWPIYLNHCFRRALYDNVCNAKWDTVINHPAQDNMSDEQLRKCLNLCRQIEKNPELLRKLNTISLTLRGKK